MVKNNSPEYTIYQNNENIIIHTTNLNEFPILEKAYYDTLSPQEKNNPFNYNNYFATLL